MERMKITWNHKLFTILLSTNNGKIHIIPKIIDNSVTIHPPTATPTPGLWPNIQFKNTRINGKSAHSNKTMLKPKKPPFKRQHWKIRFKRFDSLKKKRKGKQSIRMDRRRMLVYSVRIYSANLVFSRFTRVLVLDRWGLFWLFLAFASSVSAFCNVELS